jgi:hypothetical protein
MAETALVYRWRDGELELLDYCDMTERRIVVADSWLETDGRVLARELHRERFERTAGDQAEFWKALPTHAEGDWFPRVELHDNGQLIFRERSAPERTRSVTVATATNDPRTQPTVKGPDLETMLRLRTLAQPAGEAIILHDGFVVEGAYSALVWWRGNILCHPSSEFERVDSITARVVQTLATALGVETFEEAVTPAELDGTELWTLNALHGPRIVTSWTDGPGLAELPGRLETWRTRLTALRR